MHNKSIKAAPAERFQSALASSRGGWQPENYAARILITDRRIGIASDVHLPYWDEALVAQFLNDCADRNVEAIVWLGDLVDHPTFSHWGLTDHTTRYVRELVMLRTLVQQAATVAPTQYWSAGNHEDRLFRSMGHQIGMEQLALMAGLGGLLNTGDLIISDNPTLDAFPDTKGHAEWMLTHPAQYSPSPLVTPGKLAQRNQQNVIAAHEHHWGMGVDPSGRFISIDSGVLTDPDLHRYSQYGVTAHRAWTQGYWFLLDGQPFGVLGKR